MCRVFNLELIESKEELEEQIKKESNYLPPPTTAAEGGENNWRNRPKIPWPCLRKVEMTA